MRRLVDQEERKEELSKRERRRQRLATKIFMLERNIIFINIIVNINILASNNIIAVATIIIITHGLWLRFSCLRGVAPLSLTLPLSK